jgi:GNAT superfamily N-acetyltransferase
MISCRRADLNNEEDAANIVDLLNYYAMDIMGGAEPLSEYTKTHLIDELKRRPAHNFIAYMDGKPAGLANCFEGFSTFACKSLLNIHDFVVKAEYRRKGVGSTLMFCIEQFAREHNFCKLTLEVLEFNHGAKCLYAAHGFGAYQLDPEAGTALFWQKKLEEE